MSLPQHYIPRTGLQNLKKYTYHGVDNSLVAKKLQPMWNYLVNWLPLWMAPNLVTLIGFVFILVSYVLTFYYHPNISGVGGPRWLYLLNCVCMFNYQTMDALDGKQARRTKSSSPLGELFDHGCDAVTTVVGTITLGCTLGVDRTLLLVTLVLLMLAFYMAQWEEYYTDTMTLGYIGVTEAQIGAMGIYLISAYYGPQFWNLSVHVAGWQLRYGNIPFMVSALSAIPTALANVKEVVTKTYASGQAKGKPNPLATLAPVLAVSIGFVAWGIRSAVYYAHPHTFLLAYGFLVANLVGRIVLFRVCMESFQPLQPLIFPLALVPFVMNSEFEFGFVAFYYAAVVFFYFHFALSVIRDLCDALNIYCLSIKRTGVQKAK